MTDVVMPEMNGRDLAKNLLASHPALKHLLMSGNTADVIARQRVLDEGVHFHPKAVFQEGPGGQDDHGFRGRQSN